MYGNNYGHPGGYYPPTQGDYPDDQLYITPPAGRARQAAPQTASTRPHPGVPEYASPAPRPVYRHTAPPSSIRRSEADQQQRRRLEARFEQPARPRPDHYLQPQPPLLYDPFYLRPASPVPEQFEYSGDEVAMLRAAGFRRNHRDRLSTVADRQFQFVMNHASWLAEHSFTPLDIMDTAALAPSQRAFVAREACALDEIGLHPGQIIDLALMASVERGFVVNHGDHLRAIGFSPLQVMALAMRPADERYYVVDHGMQLRDMGHTPSQIRRQARDPSQRPALARRLPRRSAPLPPPMPMAAQPYYPQPMPPMPMPMPFYPPYPLQAPPQVMPPISPPRRVSTSEVTRRQAGVGTDARERRDPGTDPRLHRSEAPRRSSTNTAAILTTAERRGFEALGLAQEAMDRLARSSDTVRTYMLVHGGNLLASGMSFDEIVGMAEDTPVSSGTRPGSGRRHESASARSRVDDLAPMFSYLNTEDIDGDPSLADFRTAPPRTRSPQQMEAPRFSHPRNNAPLSSTESATLAHAHRRWGSLRSTSAAGEEFYRNTVPQALIRKLATTGSPSGTGDDRAATGYPDLHLLLAGVAYAEDNRNNATAPAHQARVKALTDYLTSTDDAELLRNCDSAAAEGVTHCGDRVAYGLTRVEQVVMQRKIQHGEMPPRKMFEGIESVFLQPRIENIATYLANARKARNGRAATTANYTRASFAEQVEQAVSATFVRSSGNARGGFRSNALDAFWNTLGFDTPAASTTVTDNSASESLEMYAALSPRLIQDGVNLVESAHTSTYGGMYHIDPLELDYAHNEINRHVRDLSPEFLQEFEGNSAVEKLLRQCFQQDFRTMREEREDLQDQADDALFDADAPPGTQETVRDTMTALASMEKDWYREKLKVVLAQRHLLDDLPPLAPDLAGD